MTDKVSSASAIVIVITTFFVIGSAIYQSFFSIFNFGEITLQITTIIDYVFDLIFDSLGLLSFFIRPTTLSYVCRIFCYYYLLQFEFKFIRVCVKLTLRLYEVVKDLFGKSSSMILKLFSI